MRNDSGQRGEKSALYRKHVVSVFFRCATSFFPLEFSTPLKQMQHAYATKKCLHK